MPLTSVVRQLDHERFLRRAQAGLGEAGAGGGAFGPQEHAPGELRGESEGGG